MIFNGNMLIIVEYSLLITAETVHNRHAAQQPGCLKLVDRSHNQS